MLFNKEKHTYKLNGEEYKSVSSWIDNFTNPFPKDLIAGKVAKRDGVDKDFVLKEWEAKGDLSRSYGNAIHKSIEYYIKYKEKPDHKHLKDVVDNFIELSDFEDMESEIVVFSEEKKIAGTVDVLGKNEDGTFTIIDIKTNGNINKKSSNYMKSPFEKLKDTKMNRYKLQLSMYKKLAEENGLDVSGLELWHWDGEEFKIKKIDSLLS